MIGIIQCRGHRYQDGEEAMANNERHIERRQETEKAETEGQTLSGVKAEQVRINFKIKEGGSTEVKEERQL